MRYKNLETAEDRVIDPTRCDHFIMVGEHYREDGSCRCDDPEHEEMKDWGYEWDGERWA